MSAEEFKSVPLQCGDMCLVDVADYEIVKHLSWFSATKRGVKYVKTSIRDGGKQKGILMHRMLLNCPPDMFVDHINHNTLDNRRSNLRICNAHQNQHNSTKRKNGKWPYKGVQVSPYGRWRAALVVYGVLHQSKTVSTMEEAAHEFDKLARKHQGEFAYQNFPAPPTDSPKEANGETHEAAHIAARNQARNDRGDTAAERSIDL